MPGAGGPWTALSFPCARAAIRAALMATRFRPTSRARRFPPDIAELAVVKLDLLNGAAAVFDLWAPPGNRLEALRGDLKGYHSIRINEPWRLVFRWEESNAHEVRLMDYHRHAARRALYAEAPRNHSWSGRPAAPVGRPNPWVAP